MLRRPGPLFVCHNSVVLVHIRFDALTDAIPDSTKALEFLKRIESCMQGLDLAVARTNKFFLDVMCSSAVDEDHLALLEHQLSDGFVPDMSRMMEREDEANAQTPAAAPRRLKPELSPVSIFRVFGDPSAVGIRL